MQHVRNAICQMWCGERLGFTRTTGAIILSANASVVVICMTGRLVHYRLVDLAFTERPEECSPRRTLARRFITGASSVRVGSLLRLMTHLLFVFSPVITGQCL
jgi:hypothetical protein